MRYTRKLTAVVLMCTLFAGIASGCGPSTVPEDSSSTSGTSGTLSESVISEGFNGSSGTAGSQKSDRSLSPASNKSSSKSSSSANDSSKSPTKTPEQLYPYTIKKLVLPALQWSGGPVRKDGSRSYWNPTPLASALVNLVSVIYWPFDENGNIIGGLPTAEQYQKVMEHAAYDLQKSKELGIGVIGYTDTVQFKLDVLQKAYGYTLDDLAYKDVNGNTIFTTTWDPAGNYIACINQPKWRALLTEINYLTAKAGFECLMYDFYPYAASSYFCHCSSCQKLWKEYSKKVLGKAVKMPTSFSFPDPVSIAYYKFRVESYADFMKETASKAKKYYPNFYLMQNNNMNGYDTPYSILLGALTPPTSEYWTVDNGNESSLYMYQLAEALGAETVFAYYNSDPQITPIYKYKVNLAESYAVCGAMMHHSEPTSTCSKFFHFMNDRQRVYAGSHSIAEVGILYSWESSLFSNITLSGSLMFDFRNNISRQAASALVKTGISYDFVALERKGVLERLKQYKVLVVPEYDYFVKDTWEKPVKEFVKNGGKLVVLGENARKFISGIIGSDSKAALYVDDFTSAASEASMSIPTEFKNAMAHAGATDQLKIQVHPELTAATIRQNGPDIYLHFIRRGDPRYVTNKTMKFKYRLPDGYVVDNVTAECPYTKNTSISIDWSVDKDGYLTGQTGEFDTYLLVVLKPSAIK